MLHILFGWLIPINRIWLLWGGDWNRNPKKVFPRDDVPIQGWASYYPSIAAAWGAQSGCPTGCWHLQPHGSQPAKSWWHTDEPSGIGLQAVVQKKKLKNHLRHGTFIWLDEGQVIQPAPIPLWIAMSKLPTWSLFCFSWQKFPVKYQVIVHAPWQSPICKNMLNCLIFVGSQNYSVAHGVQLSGASKWEWKYKRGF